MDGRGGVGDGFDPIGAGGGGGGRGFEQNFEVPLQPAPAPPITGQKRAFPFSGVGGSPGSDRLDGPGFAKLFVGSVPRTATEEEIRPPFEEYGNVIEVALIKDKRTGQQQGCCFIKYATSEEADRAIRGLHNQYTLPGGVGPVQVRYADGERERLGATEYKLFVGSLHKQATEPEVREIFSPYGRVDDVYLMRDEFRQSRGCGFVKYAQRDMALAAINALNGVYTMRGCDQPLIVRFADPKRPRPGDSRGGPSFGGPGFGPRFQSPGGARPPPNNFNDFNGDRVPANAWRPMAAAEQGQPLNASQFSRPNDVGISQNPNGTVSAPAPSAQMQQQAFNQPFQQYPPGGQQISPLQNSLQSPQQLTPSLKSQPQPAPSYPQNQTSHGQSGQLRSPFTPPQFGAQTSVQQNASSATALQAPPPLSINLQTQPRPTAAANQQQMGPPSNQQILQPLQSPSPMAQMLSQQTQALQASFQSSQQAFSQIQQQLQMMQPPNQNMAMQQQQQQQQSTHPTNQQNHWAKSGGGPQTTASPAGATPAAEAPSSSANVAPVKCSWTEHTSPDGFKYYYNSTTGESRWVEPEELRLFKQQQLQQQKPQVQLPQPQPQSYPHVLPTQQVQQPSQMQPQLQPQQHPQQRLQQSQLPSQSAYQASGAMGRQNVQEVAYPQYQVRPHPMNDPLRHQQQQQSVSAAQEWMWNNNNGNNKQTATALEELN